MTGPDGAVRFGEWKMDQLCFTPSITAISASNCFISTPDSVGKDCPLYTKSVKSGIPAIQYQNVAHESAPMPPARLPRLFLTPDSLIHPKALKMMGTPLRVYSNSSSNMCGLKYGYGGCAFNMVFHTEVRVIRFKNSGWDLAWYPFDSRTFYMNLEPMHSFSWEYGFPEMPREIKVWGSPRPHPNLHPTSTPSLPLGGLRQVK